MLFGGMSIEVNWDMSIEVNRGMSAEVIKV